MHVLFVNCMKQIFLKKARKIRYNYYYIKPSNNCYNLIAETMRRQIMNKNYNFLQQFGIQTASIKNGNEGLESIILSGYHR